VLDESAKLGCARLCIAWTKDETGNLGPQYLACPARKRADGNKAGCHGFEQGDAEGFLPYRREHKDVVPRVHICHRGSVHFPHERDTIPESKLCHQVAQVLFIVARPAATANRQRGSCLGRPASHMLERLDGTLSTVFPGYPPPVLVD